MNRIKKIAVCLLAVLAMSFCFIACSGGGDPASYTVTFMNGSTVYQSTTVQENNTVTKPTANPTKASDDTNKYEFKYWALNGAEYNFETPVTSNITLNAEFNSIALASYTVTFKVDGETYGDVVTVKEGKTVAKPATDPTKDADEENTYAFNCWKTEAGAVYDFTSAVTGNLVLVADFTATAIPPATTATVTFLNEDGSVYHTASVEIGTKLNEIEITNPVKASTNTENFIFRRWLKENGSQVANTFVITEDISLTASFRSEVRKYDLVYQVSGEEWVKSTREYGEKINELTPPDKADDAKYYYDFAYWVDAATGEKWDFETDTITSNVTLKAMYTGTLHPVEYETFEKGEDIPDYEWEREVAFGDDPYETNMIIDGKMGEGEGWENQAVYQTGTIQHNVYYSITTKFGEKGLYIFAQADDRTGIIWEDRNYMFGHTHFQFYIAEKNITKYTDATVRRIRVDSNNVYPTYVRSKTAIYMAEGAPNTGKAAKMNVEIYITWDELGIKDGAKPEAVKIFTQYTYKRVKGSKVTFNLYAPFSESLSALANYIVFNENGYAMEDAENATVGDSSLGIAKSVGWDMKNESAEEDAYVESTSSSTTQAIFYTGIDSNNYIVETTVKPSLGAATKGKAGLLIYKHRQLYSMLLLDINSDTYDDEAGGFKLVRATVRRCYEGGTIKNYAIDEFEMDPTQELHIKMIVAESYIYYMINDRLILCEFVQELNGVTLPALVTYNANKVRFTDYASQNLHNAAEIKEITSKYAYVVNAETGYNNVSVAFRAVGVSTDGTNNNLGMTVTNPSFTISNKAKALILNNNDFSEVAPQVTLVGKVETTTTIVDEESGEVSYDKKDITDDYMATATAGEYTLKNIVGDTIIKFTATHADEAVVGVNPSTGDPIYVADRLVAFRATIVSEFEPYKNIAATANATIYSDNPAWGRFNISIAGGDIFFIAQAGYRYWMDIVADGYRYITNFNINNGEAIPVELSNTIIDIGKPADDECSVENYIFIEPHIVGSNATSTSGSNFSQASLPGTWDLEPESEGYIYFETQNYGSGQVFFSGPTISDFQYVYVDITNVTDWQNNTNYEPDPAAGFYMTTAAGYRAFIGLRYNGLRILKNASTWEPIQVDAETGNKTVGELPREDGSTITTRLKMLKVGRLCYMYVSNVTGLSGEALDQAEAKFITCVELDPAFDKESAIGFHVTSSYYSKVKFANYAIEVDDAAKEAAKELVIGSPKLADSAYSNPRNPVEGTELISISGLSDLTYSDGTVEQVAYTGTKMTINLNIANTVENRIYTVSAGSKKVILSHRNPSAELEVDKDCIGEFDVTVESKPYVTVTGVVEVYNSDGEQEKITAPISGAMVSTTGGEIPFMTDAEGNFTVQVISGGTFKAVLNHATGLYATESSNFMASTDTDIGVVKLHESIVGGNYDTLKSTAGATLGYNNTNYGINGPYLEVNYANGDNWQILHQKQYENFVFKFSYVREQVLGYVNESDPGFGLRVNDGTGADSIMFHTTGVRCLHAGAAWADREEVKGLHNIDVRSFGAAADFMIIRRDSTYFMYSKLPSATEYKFIYAFESNAGMGPATVGIVTTNTSGRYNHYYVYNMEMSEFDATNVPAELVRQLSVSNKTEGTVDEGKVENGSYTISGGITVNDEKVYAFNDTIVVSLKPDTGFVVAYVKANGVLLPIVNNETAYTLKGDTELEIVFEGLFDERSVTADITSKYMTTLPSTINVVAEYQDGRQYTFPNTAVTNGKVNIRLRDGNFKIWAESTTAASMAMDITVNDQTTSIGTLALDTMKVSSVEVNGADVKPISMRSDYLASNGGYVVTDRIQSSGQAYMPLAVSSGKTFFFSTKLTMSGDPTSPFYTPDNVHGISLTDGGNTLAIMFWDNCLRVCKGGWSDKGDMVKVKIANSNYYNASAGTQTHEMAVLGSEDGSIKIYVDKKLVLTLTTAGFNYNNSTFTSSEQATTGNSNGTANITAVVNEIMNGAQVACGFAYNINMGIGGVRTNALFHEAVFSKDATEIATLTADYVN